MLQQIQCIDGKLPFNNINFDPSSDNSTSSSNLNDFHNSTSTIRMMSISCTHDDEIEFDNVNVDDNHPTQLHNNSIGFRIGVID
jgi:hypothetical protein